MGKKDKLDIVIPLAKRTVDNENVERLKRAEEEGRKDGKRYYELPLCTL